jgi:hypothetical protein
MDKVDALFRASTNSPTLTWGADSSNPVLGTGGFKELKVLRLFPGMVICHFRIFTGTASFTAGSGDYFIAAPTGVATEYGTFFESVPVGKAILYDNDNVLTSSVLTVNYQVTANAFRLRHPAGGSNWSPTVPITLAVNDRVSGYFMYKTSDA